MGDPGLHAVIQNPAILMLSLSKESSLVGMEQPHFPQGFLGGWPGAVAHLHLSLMHKWKGGQISITSRIFSSNH